MYDENVAKGLKAGGSFPTSPTREVTSTLLSLREKVIAYPDDCWAGPKSIFQTTYIFAKRPVEIWGVLYLSKNVDLSRLFNIIIRVMIKENVCGRKKDDFFKP